jgi:hypothetical protein
MNIFEIETDKDVVIRLVGCVGDTETNFTFIYKGICTPDIINNRESFEVTKEKLIKHKEEWEKENDNFEGFLDYFDWVN